MSIHDRDYMKRRSTGDDSSLPEDGESRLERALGGFLAKHPHFFFKLTVTLVVLVIVVVLMARLGKH